MVGVCIFCGDEAATLTVEDIIPRWLQRHMPQAGPTIHVISDAAAGQRVLRRPFKITAKVVCSPCNTQWMSDIQNRASKPMKLMTDASRVHLDAAAQDAVAAWAAMTICTWQYAMARQHIPEGHLRQLRETHMAPPGTVVWIGRYTGDRLMSFYLEPGQLSAPGVSGDRTKGYGATLVVGQLVMQAFGHSIDRTHVSITLGDAARFFQPLRHGSETVTWPPGMGIDEPTLVALEKAFHSPSDES